MIIKESFLDIFKQIIKNKYQDIYRTRKYNEHIYFEEILYVLKNLIFWSGYVGKIPWKTLHKKHLEYTKKGYYNLQNMGCSTQTQKVKKES